MSHLAGAQEPEARAWETQFSDYFGSRFGDLATDTVTMETLKSLSQARILISKAQEMASVDPTNPRIFGTVAKLAETLSGLPYRTDALALELKMKPRQSRWRPRGPVT
jgi:hypothetical protein